ncbi:MAG: energy transducer TonB [Pyrinomonadaceae bacterium]|nr:energy transducer TonB [Pyrinomonadaceae bacterium]
MNTLAKSVILTIVFLAFVSLGYAQNCKPKLIVFPADSKTVTLKGNIKKCPEYLLQIKKNQRLQIKLTSANSNVYFALDPANPSAEEEGGDSFCEDCREFDDFFGSAGSWKIFVYGDETVENKPVEYILTITLTDSAIVEGGVLNGKAISLPKPPFPKEARRTGASGLVTVKVLLDETGKVLTAEAVSGNKVFYDTAEEAAVKASFTPTLRNGKPVRVEGVIVYNFKP